MRVETFHRRDTDWCGQETATVVEATFDEQGTCTDVTRYDVSGKEIPFRSGMEITECLTWCEEQNR